MTEFNGLRSNSLRIETGNLFRPCRELNRAIREFIRLIRESRAGALSLRRKPASEPSLHYEQGAGEDELHPCGAWSRSRIRRPPDASTLIRSRTANTAAKENVRPAEAPVTLDTIVARREERACRQEPKQ